MQKFIEIMDTTLRDGEQTDGVSFSAFEKKQISHLLLEHLNVDRIEIASARVSIGEAQSVREVFEWAHEAGIAERIEILGFVDGGVSVDWIVDAGGSCINLLTKGSERHCRLQLGKTVSEHLSDIEKTIRYAAERKCRVNVYLEDWSNGYLQSPDYVSTMVDTLLAMPIERLLLPDTLGILAPEEVYVGIRQTLDRHPEAKVDFHGHNDYALATANCLAAVRAGASGIHVAVNGLGERAGNAPLESVVTALHDKLGVRTSIVERSMMDASRLVETFSGKRVSSNRPIVGRDVYTQTAGIHADGDKKHNLYYNPILPERFGRQRVYALGKLAGRASIHNNLKQLGLELSADREKMLLDRIKELGERKTSVTVDDLPFLMEDLFGAQSNGFVRRIEVIEALVTTRFQGKPSADVTIELDGRKLYASGEGDGGYDAFMAAIGTICEREGIIMPELIDYEIRIPPGGRSDALVEAFITWKAEGESRGVRTVGVDSDQLRAAIKATEKMLNRQLAPQRAAEAAQS